MSRFAYAILPALALATSNATADIAPATEDRSGAAPPGADPNESPSKEHLGRRGQFVIMSGTQFDMRRTVSGWASPSAGLSGGTSISLMPSFDYLLTDHLTVGGSFGLGLLRGDTDTTAILFSVSPRIGYHVPLGSHVSLWPQARVAYGQALLDYDNFVTVGAGASLPIVVELVPHFFVGGGPDFNISKSTFSQFGGDHFVASSGVTTMIGGWI